MIPDAPPTDLPPTIRETLRRLGPAAPLAVAVVCLPPLGSFLLVTLATTTSLAAWMREHGPMAMFAYIVVFWIFGICCLPTYAYSVLGGWAFGFVHGALAACAAYAGASLIAFAVARRVASDRVAHLAERYPRLEAVRHVLADAGFARSTGVIALLRISPASPFAITNFVLGASGVGWGPFAIGTLAGVVPRTFAIAWVASRASEISFEHGAWLFTVGIVLSAGAVTFIGAMARRELDRVIERRGSAQSTGGRGNA